MKTSIKLPLIIAATLMFGACNPSTSTAPIPTHTDLVTYNAVYNKIAATYDMDSFLGLYSNNPLWIAPTEAPAAGLEVPRNTFGFLSAKKGILTHTADHTFISKDGSQAVLIGRYDIAINAVGVKADGTYLFVMERDGDGWKIVVDMFNEHKKSE